MRTLRLIAAAAALLGAIVLHAQEPDKPFLERTISLEVNGEALPAVLAKIATQGGFSFSYNAQLIPADKQVTLTVKNKTIREVLSQLLPENVRFKEKGKHIILTRAPATPRKTTAVLIISGYVENEVTGEKVPDASVYDKTTLASAVTDSYGYYKIKLDPARRQEPLQLSVRKANFRDTLVIITASENQYLTISIKPKADSVTITVTPQDTVKQIPDEAINFPFTEEANVRNIHDTLYRDVQISILPFVGSNGRLSGNIINDYSINFFGGYSRGTRRIELGFFFNADHGDVSYLQIAGIGNLVYRNVYGFQAAGLFNLTGGDVRAVQLAGLGSVNIGEAKGIQGSGLANINLKSADGVLITGGVNLVQGKSEGFQGAGLGNVQIKDYKGSQVAGLTNLAFRKISGSQVSGVFNYGRQVNGSQVTGVFNYGRNVRGSQVGLFNYADSLAGFPVGLISFVNHGYHQIELSADEVFYTNIGFRTGVRQFYNILNAGVQPESMFGNNETVWTFGYGAGTAPRISRWLSMNIDLTANQVNRGRFTTSLSLLNKLYVGAEVRLARKFRLAFGGTVNGYLSNPGYDRNPVLFTDYQPRIFSDHNFNSKVNLKMWFGAKAALRFL